MGPPNPVEPCGLPTPRLRLRSKTTLSLEELATEPLEAARQLELAAERPLMHLDDPEADCCSETDEEDPGAARS